MNVQAFMRTLPVMGYGMLGIFVVLGVIFGVIVLLNRFTRDK